LVTSSAMLRKVLWNGLFAVFGAAATIAARTAAARIWKLTTGEDPPIKGKRG
jgi:hypothetical protein